MSSSANTVSTYFTSELAARTSFVLDRATFLTTVWDAVTFETTNKDACKTVEIIATNDYIRIISRFIEAKESEIVRLALMVLGNLTASENMKAANEALKVCSESLPTIFGSLHRTADVQEAAAYVIRAISIANPRMPGFAERLARHLTVDSFFDSVPKEARRDLVRALETIEVASHTELTIEQIVSLTGRATTLGDPVVVKNLLIVLGERLSGEVPDQICGHVYDVLRTILLSNPPAFVLPEAYWALSNLMVEPGMANVLVNDTGLLTVVMGAVKSSVARARAQALWVLVNLVACVTGDHAKTGLVEDTDLYSIIYSILYPYSPYSVSLTAALNDALDRLETMRAEYMATSDDEEDEFSGEDMEIDEDAATAFADEAVADAAVAEAFEEFMETMAQQATATTKENVAVPTALTALDLLHGGPIHHCSFVVADLIHRLVLNGVSPMTIPEGVALTGDDIVTLERLGYTVTGGKISINPYIVLLCGGARSA
jgi:hypothetical protein